MIDSSKLKKKAVHGVIWTSIQRFLTIFIQFVSGIILARLLSPDDFGCIGMLSIFMIVASSFIDGGFGSALIQKKRPSQTDYSTIFFWNFIVSIFIYLVLYISAPYIARYYHTELLSSVLRVQALVLIFNALTTIHINKLNKEFNFRKISVVSLISIVISLTVTIVMAYHGYGVWSLVTQNLLMAIIPTVIYWVTCPWRPTRVFSTQSFKELFGFGFYVLLTHIINNIGTNVQGLLIGRVYNPSVMGYYSKANNTEKLASASISQVIGQVSYPLYAEMQNDKVHLILTLKKLTQLVTYVTFPLMFLLILLATPIFILLYSEKWLPAVPYFQILCLAGLAICLHAINTQSIAAIGKSKVMFVWAFIKQIGGFILMLVGFYLFGIKGLLIGMVIKSWLIYVINASLVSKYIGYRLWKQLNDIFPVIVISIISFGIAYFLGELANGLNLYAMALLKLSIYVMIYILCSIAFKLEAYAVCMDLLQPFVYKIKNKYHRS